MLGGVKNMRRLPDALFIIDTKKERLAVAEARRLEIPIVAMVDTNADPDEVTYPIPANDDAIRAVRLICERIADAVIEGRMMRKAPEEEAVAEEDLSALPMSFAPDEDEAVAPLDAELSHAPPAVPEVHEAAEPVPAAEHSPAR